VTCVEDKFRREHHVPQKNQVSTVIHVLALVDPS